jgi:drug/metabolite transporter (DMT)-like permease
MKADDRNGAVKTFIALHVILMVYSFGSFFSKTASMSDFLSLKFVLCYGMLILILGIYAIAWQQIIKKIPLTTAYANKAITVVWGLVWGFVFFGEKITIGKLLGVALIVIGIVLFATADKEERR